MVIIPRWPAPSGRRSQPGSRPSPGIRYRPRAYSGVNAGLGALTVAYAFATVTYSESMTRSAAEAGIRANRGAA